MQLYTKDDLLRRAWVADARQADMMIDAIAASYNGDLGTFDCIMNGVANLHWMIEVLKCTDPSSTKTQTVLSTEEILQQTELTFAAYQNFVSYDITINQTVNGVFQSVAFSFSTAPGNNINTVLSYFETQFNASSLLDVSAAIGDDPNTIIVTAGDGNPIFTTSSLQRITAVEILDGAEVSTISSVETPVGRCLTDDNISGIVLKIERMVGSLCGCDPEDLVDDTLPDVIKFTNPNIFPVLGGPIQIISIGGIIPPPIVPEEPEFNDFNIQDFNPQEFA